MAAAIAAAALLAGCGGGETENVGADGQVTVRMDEYRFEPQSIVSETGDLTVRVINDGAVAHNWRVFEQPPSELTQGDEIEQLDDDEKGEFIGGSNPMAAGDEQTVRLNLQPGTYKIFSSLEKDGRLGMEGEITVEGP